MSHFTYSVTRFAYGWLTLFSAAFFVSIFLFYFSNEDSNKLKFYSNKLKFYNLDLEASVTDSDIHIDNPVGCRMLCCVHRCWWCDRRLLPAAIRAYCIDCAKNIVCNENQEDDVPLTKAHDPKSEEVKLLTLELRSLSSRVIDCETALTATRYGMRARPRWHWHWRAIVPF